MHNEWDSVYGKYKLPDVCGHIITSLEFQRLREITVMGPASWVFPSANHSMYEHSIGSAIFAHMWCSDLMNRYEFVTETDVVVTTVAALLKNIGCMPWEVVFRDFVSKHGDTTKMEHASVSIASIILQREPFGGLDTNVIRDIIVGKHAPPKWVWSDSYNNRMFMFDIVNAPCNAVLVDYVVRCNARVGIHAKIDISDIIHNSWIGKSTHLITREIETTTVIGLGDSINRNIQGHVTASAISVAIQSVWESCVWIKEVTQDVTMLLRVTDLTFKTDTEFIFFYSDLLARRYPILKSEREYDSWEDVDAFIRDNPTLVYHMFPCKQKLKQTFLLRVFYSLPPPYQ